MHFPEFVMEIHIVEDRGMMQEVVESQGSACRDCLGGKLSFLRGFDQMAVSIVPRKFMDQSQFPANPCLTLEGDAPERLRPALQILFSR